ncbi:UvrD-helicase domain-containing protein [Paraclostridium sordellii]|uniref:UvrD-helicase domain-containing protein n=1 Tax=Paraclostridium sordellii TaxID=1505 RepID=UPI0022E4146A|nr:UvrD-helicase domain-containing protein [Paeniclostridium sordellii]
MGLNIIKNDVSELTLGENKLLNKLKNIYKDYNKEAYLYIQPKISSLVPDFILIDSQRGISILEVKDWSISYIRDINKRKVELSDRPDDNPVYKTSKYLAIAKGLVSTDDNMEFIEDNIYANTVLTNISSKDIENTGIQNSINQPPVKCITSDMMSKISIQDLFSTEVINISGQEIVNIRTLFFPEIKIKKVVNDSETKEIIKTIKALDIEQENFARRLPYGHYMVTGVPGSGKTVILIARALHLIKENPDWRIKIVTYNNSLTNKIESILNSIASDIKDNMFLNDIQIQNIDVTTFHKMAKNIANVNIPRPTPQEWWNETLPKLALEKSRPMYDAILIDEYQDFRDDWIRVCIKLCKRYTYKNSSKEQVEGINLFMAGDRLQSIYNSKVHNWNKDFGINMTGRSKLLKTSYRAGKENTILALKFLQENDTLEKEVNNFYKDDTDKGIEINDIHNSSVGFVEGDYSEIVNCINDLMNRYNYNDILVVCNCKSDCEKLKNILPNNIRYNTRFVKEAKNNDMKTCLLTSTYYSSKGLEAKAVILVDVDKFTNQLDTNKEVMDRKLLYVGMTRASERLVIHASNLNKESFANTIRDLYEKDIVFA